MNLSDPDYEWYLQSDLSSYEGQWVAILDQRVVAHGANAKDVLEQVLKDRPESTPLLVKVLPEELFVFFFFKCI